MDTGELLGKTCDGLASRPGGVEILQAVSCHGTGISSGPMSQLAKKASLLIDSQPEEFSYYFLKCWLISASTFLKNVSYI